MPTATDLPEFAGRLLTGAAMAPYLTDWRGLWHGGAMAVAMPDTAEAAARLIGWCAGQGVPVVPQGGNTGLAGGATPDASGRALVISTSRLNRIRQIDLEGQSLTAEAGCTLAAVQEAAEASCRLFPLRMGSQGSCTIGGNLATNAGGTSVLRYGSARELCLGLEVVTARGEIWNGLRRLRKDNTGLDLRDLFVGSEGTLGLITAAVLKLYPRPASRAVAVVCVASPADALSLLNVLGMQMEAGLTACELMDAASLDLVRVHFPETPRLPSSPWFVLVEASGADSRPALEASLLWASDEGLIADAILAASEAQESALWTMRERIPEAQGREGPSLKHDVSVPLTAIPDFVTRLGVAMARDFPMLRLMIFGHVGDGNLHVNVLPQAGDAAPPDDVTRMVHDLVAVLDGSISAEHGLGVLRAAEALRLKSPVEIAMLRAVRRALDPNGIMNPGKGIGAEPAEEKSCN